MVALLAVSACGQAPHRRPLPRREQRIQSPDSVETRIGTLNFERGTRPRRPTQKLFDEMDFPARRAGLPVGLSGRFVRVDPGRRQAGPRRRLQRYGHRRQVRRPQGRLAHGQRHHDLRLMNVDLGKSGRSSSRSRPGRIVGLIDDFWQRVDHRRRPARSRRGQGRQVSAPAARLQGRGSEGGLPCPAGHDEQLQHHGSRHRGEHDDIAAAVETIKKLRVYPWSERDNPKPNKFVSMSGKVMDTLPPDGIEYWARLSAFINNNPVRSATASSWRCSSRWASRRASRSSPTRGNARSSRTRPDRRRDGRERCSSMPSSAFSGADRVPRHELELGGAGESRPGNRHTTASSTSGCTTSTARSTRRLASA